MEIVYDKAALQSCIENIGSVQMQMRRRQEESLSLYESCRERYNRLYTRLEEIKHRAYLQLENAESLQRTASSQYSSARMSAEYASEENQDAARQQVSQAQAMLAEAGRETASASAEYEKASRDLQRLTELWDQHAQVLDPQVQRVENTAADFHRLAARGSSDLQGYMQLIEKSREVLNGGTTAEYGVQHTAGEGSRSPEPDFRSSSGNTLETSGTDGGAPAFRTTIGGVTRTYAGTKSGMAKAYRDAVKNGDPELAEYATELYYGRISLKGKHEDQGNTPVSGSPGNGGENAASRSEYNRKIAAAMVSEGLAYKVDFGGLDPRTARDIYVTVSENLAMFPELELKFVGSLQARNQAIERKLGEFYLEAYRKYYPQATDEELMPYVHRHVLKEIEQYKPSQATVAQSLSLKNLQTYGDTIFADFNGISINEDYGKDYPYFMNVRKKDVEAGWKPVGCSSPKASVDHEMGHQIDDLLNAYEDPVIQGLYEQFRRLDSKQKGSILSGYAGENIHEFIAEAWSEYRNNPQCRPLATNIAARIFELYNETARHKGSMRR